MKFFHIVSHKNETKSADKAFTQAIIISVIGFMICITALCSATWAWFTASISSTNTIETSSCTMTVTLKDNDTALTPVGDKYSLEKDKDYVVEISVDGTGKTSYCILVVDGVNYYTEQIPTKAPDNQMSFTINFTEAKTLEVLTRWGTSSTKTRTFENGAYYVDLTKQPAQP